MKNIICTCFILAATCVGMAAPGNAAGQEKRILEMTKNSWVAYRNYAGRQIIYFTHLEAWKCGITQVTYSINSEALDQIYELRPCDPNNPNAITTDTPFITMPLGTSKTIAVQLTYEDGTKSEVVRMAPPEGTN